MYYKTLNYELQKNGQIQIYKQNESVEIIWALTVIPSIKFYELNYLEKLTSCSDTDSHLCRYTRDFIILAAECVNVL